MRETGERGRLGHLCPSKQSRDRAPGTRSSRAWRKARPADRENHVRERETRMITDHDMIEARDDRRHAPAADSLPLWNESYWFSFYDPAARIGVVTRMGILQNQGEANVWFYVSKDGKIAHRGTDLRCGVPAGDIDALRMKDVTYRCLEPLRKFRLTYEGTGASMDVTWSGAHPVFLYPVDRKS